MNFVTPKQIKHHIEKYKPQYATILGMRSNGKSSAVKSFCLDEMLENENNLDKVSIDDNLNTLLAYTLRIKKCQDRRS